MFKIFVPLRRVWLEMGMEGNKGCSYLIWQPLLYAERMMGNDVKEWHSDRLVAVVIPVFDAENTLDRCVASVCAQEESRLEIILVDDGSRDRSGVICDEWAAKDRRVKVIHQKNRGRTAARAAGVEVSTAEWINFVDSDDWLPQGSIAKLCAAATPDVDIVLGNGYRLEKDYGNKIPMEQFRHMAVRGEGTIGVPWGTLFRRSVVTPYSLELPKEFCMGEDYIFWLRVVFGTNRPVKVVYEKVYEKGADTTSSNFIWDVDYATMLNEWRKEAIPVEERENYLTDMIEDRLVNLMAIALHAPRACWVHSRFYRELQDDMKRTGFVLPGGLRIYLSLPGRWLRKWYSQLSDWKRNVCRQIMKKQFGMR